VGRRAFWKQGGIVGRKPREGVPPNAKHRSREWGESPEVTLAIIDSIGQVACGWNILTRGQTICRIDGVDVEVFITGLVLRKQNVLAVAAPEVQVNGRAVSAVIGLALAKGSVVRLTQMLRVPLKGLMKAMNTPSGEI
jgi:hypothetical protein